MLIILSLPMESMEILLKNLIQIAAISFNHIIFRTYNLKMRPNTFLMAPNMKTVVRSGGLLGEEIVKEHPRGTECHFLHTDGEVVAALSHCTDDDIVQATYF